MTKELWKDVLRVWGIILAISTLFVIIMIFTPYWGYKIITGTALGVLGAALSFLFLAISVSKAVEHPQNGATVYIQGSYTIRLIFMAAVIIIGFKLPYFNGYATIVPFVSMQPAIMLTNAIFNKKKAKLAQAAIDAAQNSENSGNTAE